MGQRHHSWCQYIRVGHGWWDGDINFPKHEGLTRISRVFRHREAWAYILDQHPGYGIIVAPGWLHCVFNVQYCVKYAVEFVKAMNVPAYVQAYREATYLHGDVNGEPYMMVLSHGVDFIKKVSLSSNLP